MVPAQETVANAEQAPKEKSSRMCCRVLGQSLDPWKPQAKHQGDVDGDRLYPKGLEQWFSTHVGHDTFGGWFQMS